MEQLNNATLPNNGQSMVVAERPLYERKESQLLVKVRQNFGIFGGISLLFGILFTLLFYKAYFGLNYLLFTFAMVALLRVTVNKLGLKMKVGTYFYYAGALLLALSSTLTTSIALLFFNTIGILLLLELSLLHQFYDNKHWDFMKYLQRMLVLPFVCIATLGMPFIDSISFLKKTKVLKNDKFRNIFLGLIISVPCLWIIISLLSSADLLFDMITSDIFDFSFSAVTLWPILMITFGFLACYCIICGSVSGVDKEEKKERKKADASIAITFMAILCLVYIVFCFIQVAYLFTDGLLTLPAGITYAEYARRGFFELLRVSIMNVSLILLCKTLFQESKVLRRIVLVMTLCTYIMIASATYRMLLYIGAYHLTFLRSCVLLALLIIALVLGGVIYAEYNKRFPLFQYCVAVVSICYICFSLSKPDYWIADYLVNQKEELNQQDIDYLVHSLSLDATPVVLPMLYEDYITRSNTVEDKGVDGHAFIYSPYSYNEYHYRVVQNTSNQGLRGFNYSKYLARKTADKYSKED